ncbi:MAG TPA: phosphoribosylanthranilate isomerase [Candidatus Angelobacter sp.]|nr:phosphoribosylanthranilate isomerase [Candidatus Angelobacter sp.]
MRTWIKFCGTTTVEDALAAVEAGADALGFIFAPSPRRVTVQQARQIIHELPQGMERIGVFRDETAEEIRKIVTEVALTGIQLHGDENVSEIYDRLPRSRRDSLRIIKTLIVQKRFETRLDADNGRIVSAWLLDSGAGSGKTFDWQAARAQLGEGQGRFIIAGGLTPGNVGEAIRAFSPWGVDVVSGIEREPGRKDPEKMKAFVAAVRKAGQR